MATVTKPIALNESFNTTEQTPRNLADVLAQALQMLNTTISGLNFINCVVVQTLPTTDISTTTIYLVPKNPSQTDNLYDEYINLTGTSAGWEKIGDTEIDLSGYYTSAEVDDLLADKADVSDIPTVNDGTLTIQQNGETKGTFTANQSGNSTVNIEIPTTDIQTAVDEFETYNGGLLSSCKVALSPNQDLHGYDHPWVGGAGKNKLENSYTTRTINGVTFTVYSDGTVMVEGTATGGLADFVLGTFNSNGVATILNGCPSGGSSSTYTLNATGGYSDTGNGVSLPASYNNQVYIRIRDGYAVPSGGLLFKPMIRLATETDPTFESYENICPISGHTQSKVDVSDGVNKINPDNMGHYGRDNATGQIDRTEANMSSTTNLVKVDPSTTYTIARNGTKYVLRVYYYGVDKSYIGNEVVDGTFTTPNDVYYIAWQSGNASGALDLWSMVEGSSSTYAPYNGYRVTVNLGGTYYGGNLDVVNGVFTPDTAGINLSDIGWSGSNGAFYSTNPISDIKHGGGRYDYATSSGYKTANKSSLSQLTDGEMSVDASGYLQIKDSQYTTSASFVSDRGSIQIVYELATPTTIQLIPTPAKALVGENHLSAPLDGQEITESKYKKMFTFDDVIAYIQSLS